MKICIKKLLLFTMILIFIFPNRVFASNEETFYIYVYVIDENGDPYTKADYEPGFMAVGGMPSHNTLNGFGVATVSIYKASDNQYRYYVYGDAKDIYNNIDDLLTIDENYFFIKIELARTDSGQKSNYTLIKPGDSNYPSDPINPEGENINKVAVSGYVRDKNGGIKNAVVSVKNPTKFPEENYTETTTTDANGHYTLTNIDEIRFGTAWITARFNDKLILTSSNGEFHGNTFNTLDVNKSYDFYSEEDLGGADIDTPDIDTPDQEPDSSPNQEQQPVHTEEQKEKTPEQKWTESKNNPENYAVSIKDSTGKKQRSEVPAQSRCKDETKAIVTQKLEEAEKSFGKSNSENQIVITISDSQCGPELRKLLGSKVEEHGAVLGSIYEIKAEERAKKDYVFVRDIHKVLGDGVIYTISLSQELQDELQEGKHVRVLWYDSEGGIQVLEDLDTDEATLTIQTSRPSGTFVIF